MHGSPWENGYCESFNSKLRDELLNGEIFYTLKEAQNRHRELATALKYYSPALIPGLQTTGTRGHCVACCAKRTCFAGHPHCSAKTKHH